jgi:hypothetical protein
MEAVEAATQTVGNGASTSLFGLLGSGQPGAIKMVVRTPATGVYVGGSGVSTSQGFPLLADTDYTFILRPTVGNTTSAAHALNVYNNSGSSASVSWIATAAE